MKISKINEVYLELEVDEDRSEERRVGKEGRCRLAPYDEKKNSKKCRN